MAVIAQIQAVVTAVVLARDCADGWVERVLLLCLVGVVVEGLLVLVLVLEGMVQVLLRVAEEGILALMLIWKGGGEEGVVLLLMEICRIWKAR